MPVRSFKYMVLAAPLMLAACGEGYEAVRTDQVFPYGNERTAGSTIMYVQKKLLPERQLNLEPAQPEAAYVPPEPEVVVVPVVIEPEPEEEPVEDAADQVFEDAQRK